MLFVGIAFIPIFVISFELRECEEVLNLKGLLMFDGIGKWSERASTLRAQMALAVSTST